MAEFDLYAKVLTTMHLTVPDRRMLPNGHLSFVALLRAAGVLLAEEPWLPRWGRERKEFEGIVIERRGAEYWVHECHESGVDRFGPVEIRRPSDLAHAVRALLRANGGDAIDGVLVDYDG